MKKIVNNGRGRVRHTKKNKTIKKKYIIFVLIVILAIIGAIAFNLIKNNGNSNLTSEILRSMSYIEVEDGDEDIDGIENVEFDAFFLKDLDSDGTAESIRGTCNEVGGEGTLYINLNVIEEGYVTNGVITINAQNFYLKTSIVADDEVSQNYISTNTAEIELNDITNGTQKLLLGYVRSGDYSSESTKTAAIGTNTNNYSRDDNYIEFSGTYVDSNGNETEFTKQVYFTVDWYGEVNASISAGTVTSGNSYTYTYSDLDSLVSGDYLTLTFTIYARESLNELIMYGSYIYGTISDFNGYSATSCTITGSNITYTWDAETQEFTAQKEAIVNSSGEVTTKGYTSTYNNSTRYTSYKFTIQFPAEAYEELGDVTSFTYTIPINTYNKGYNNQNEDDGFENPYISSIVTSTMAITYKETTEDMSASLEVYVGTYTSSPYNDYTISKQKPLNIYDGVSESEEDDIYKVQWKVYTGTYGETGGLILQETQTDKFEDSSSTYISMEECTENIGIYFLSATSCLGSDGWIKLYDADTDVLLETFTENSWDLYNSSNPYYYDNSVDHIRIETSETIADTYFYVYSIKELDDEYITENYTRDDFDELTNIYSYLTGYMLNIEDESSYYWSDTVSNNAQYIAPISIATISIEEGTISTQKTAENEIITIKTDILSSNTRGWIDGEFLVKLPDDILLAEINNVKINNSNVTISAYDLYEENGCWFIKILTSNEDEESYTITIDCDLTADPRITSTVDYVKLYAINGTGYDYYYSAKDEYDLNGNYDFTEYVNYATDSLTMEPGITLTPVLIASGYDETDGITIAPRVAKTEAGRNATVIISITNNYTYDVTDIVILGVIPTEGNVSLLSGADMKSDYSTYITGEIEIPEELEEYVTIYYSSNLSVTNDLATQENGWITADEVTDWNEIVTYLIVIDSSYELEIGDTIEFTYEISIPNGIGYNETSYAGYAVYYALDTEEGLYYTQTSAQKLGFMVAKQYDLSIIKYQEDTSKTIQGVTFILTEDGEESSSIGTTDEDGITTYEGLYVERYYTLSEYSVTDDYVLNSEEIKFYTYTEVNDDDSESLYLAYVDEDGNYKDITEIYSWIKSDEVADADSDSESDYKITIELENEALSKLKITKTDENGDILKNVKFKLTNGNETKIYTTNSSGEITVSGIYLDIEYTLTEIKATGYYVSEESITFMISNVDGEFVLTYSDPNNTTISYTVTTEDEIPTINLTLVNEEIQTYNLKIIKYAEDSDETLEGGQFKIYGDGISTSGKVYTTGENGSITIEGLYEYVDGKYFEGEYNITEIYAPDGYALDSTTLSFKVYRDDNENLVFEILDGENLIRTITSDDNEETQDITINQDTDTITIGVENSEIFTLAKIDGDTGGVIEGAKFKILDTDGNYVTGTDGEIVGTLEIIDGEEMYVVTTDEFGEISASLTEGTYMAIEVYVSEEYDLPENEQERTYYFEIGESKETETSWIGILGEDWEQLSSITVSQSNYMVCVGSITSFSEENGTDLNDDGIDEISSSGNYDGLVVSYDEEGTYEWSYALGGSGDERLNEIVESSDGGYILVGYTSSDYVYYGDSLISEISIDDNENLAHNDGILIKISATGSYEWGVRIGGTYDDEITSVIETSDGNIAITGTYYSDTFNFYNTGDLSNSTVSILKGVTDGTKMNGFVASYTNTGSYNWSQNISGTYDVEAVDVIETSAGIAVAINYIGSSSVPVYLDTDKSYSEVGASSSYVNGLVAGYDLDGNYLWRYRFYPSSASYNVEIGAISTGLDNDIYVAVNHSYILYGGENGQTGDEIYSSSTSYYAGTVVELTNTGELIGAIYTLDGTYDDFISSIDVSSYGEIAIGGWFYSTTAVDVDGDGETGGDYDFNAINGTYTSDAFLISMTNAGVVTNSSQIYGDGYDIVSSVTWTLDNSEVIAVGSFTSTELYATNIDEDDVLLTNNGNTDGFITYGAITSGEISNSSSIMVENYLKEFTITTEVIEHDEDGESVEGGSITGETGLYNGITYIEGEILYVETIKYNEDGTIDVVITPDEGYLIVEITINGETFTDYTINDDGTVTIVAFTSVTQDYHITVEFSSTIGYVEVNHILWNETEGCTETRVADSTTMSGEDGEEYSTLPETDIDYEIITNADYYGDDLPDTLDGDDYYIPDNYTGTYVEGEKIVVNYYYKEKTYTLTVHHYLVDTEVQVPLKDGSGTVEDEYYEGYYSGDEYTTTQAEEDMINYNIYELVEIPEDAEGTITENTVVTYYYQIIQIDLTITKVSSEDSSTIEGVEFSLYELICDDSSHEHDTNDDLIDTENYDETCWELIDTYTTASDGTFTLSDIVITGIYRLVETKTIDNYLLPSGQWKIEFGYDDNLDEDKAITVNGVTLQITGISNPPAVTAGDDTIYIYNSSSYDIPTTGAMGIEDYITIGVIIILVGAVGKIHKSKRTVGLRSSRIKASRAEAKNIKKISKMQKRCRKMQKKTEKMLKK